MRQQESTASRRLGTAFGLGGGSGGGADGGRQRDAGCAHGEAVAGRHRRRDDADPVIDRLRRRFAIARVCVVADRGMISAEAIAELETRRLLYILGVRERTDKLVRELVLDDPAPFVPLALTKRGKKINYEAKTVKLAGRRYIVCR